MLNIIGGEFKGARLISPKGTEFRPTLGKIREVLFSVLLSRYQLTDFDCFDLFAGSGALGLEAVSRGARQAVFVDNNRQHIQILKKNILRLALGERCQTYVGDAIHWLTKNRWQPGLKLFLIDPPYQSDLAQGVIDLLAGKAAQLQNGLVVIESNKHQTFQYPGVFTQFQQKVHGLTKLDFLEFS